MSSSSEFPLFLLPIIALQHVLKWMPPFESVILSLTSKRSKTICQSVRRKANKKGFCKIETLSLQYSSMKEVEISSPIFKSIFQFERLPKSKSMMYNFFSSIFHAKKNFYKLIDGVYVSSYASREGNKKGQLYTLYFDCEDVMTPIHSWILLLENILKVNLAVITLDLNSLIDHEQVPKIMEFCEGNRKPVATFTLTGNVEPSKHDLIREIINRQNATTGLVLNFKTGPGFNYDFKNLRTMPTLLSIENSRWITLDNLFDMNMDFVFLGRTSLKSSDFKCLFQKWIDGWHPKWFLAKLVFGEHIDLDIVMNEIEQEIRAVEGNTEGAQKIEFRRIESRRVTPDGILEKIKYGIFCPGMITALVAIEAGFYASFHFSQPSKGRNFSVKVYDELLQDL